MKKKHIRSRRQTCVSLLCSQRTRYRIDGRDTGLETQGVCFRPRVYPQPMERLQATPASSPWQRASDYFRCKECSALTRVSVPRSHAVRVAAAAEPRSPCGPAGPRGVLSRPHGTAPTAPPACPGAGAHGVPGPESRSRVGPSSFLGCGLFS